MLVVRDPLGVKPLYYAQHAIGFTFASELKTLLLDKNLKREIDLEAVSDYMCYLWSPSPRTMLKNVCKLEPGNFLLVRDGKIIKKQQYYELPLQKEADKKHCCEEEYIEQTQFHLKNAISRQLVSDVPIGAFLSGGLDSSAIVALMRNINPEVNVDCYTIGFKNQHNEGFVADLPYAKKVAEHLGVNLNTIYVDDSIYKSFPDAIYYLDEPQADPAVINTMMIASLAKKHGYKVLMSGAGGDDIFSGYRKHRALRYKKYFHFMPKVLRRKIANYFREYPAKFAIGNSAYKRRLAKMLKYIDYIREHIF